MVSSCQSDQYGCPATHHCYSAAAPAAADSGSVWCVSESAGLWRGARMGILRMSTFTFQHERGDADQSGPPWHHLWKPTWKVLHTGQWHSPEWTHRSQFTRMYVNTRDEETQSNNRDYWECSCLYTTRAHTPSHSNATQTPCCGSNCSFGKKGLCK